MPRNAAGARQAAAPGRRPPRRNQEERSWATRDALLRAAVELLIERGYAATTTSLVAERAGVSRGALQHHFKSRDELIGAVMERLRAQIDFRIDPAGLAARPVPERVDAMVEHYRAMCLSRAYRAALNLLIGINRDSALFRELSRQMRAGQEGTAEDWEAIFHDLKIDPPALRSIRRIVIGSIRGYELRERVDAAGDWTKDARVLKEMFLHQLMRSARPVPLSPPAASGPAQKPAAAIKR
jgi:AcrR family transcriptional regulator